MLSCTSFGRRSELFLNETLEFQAEKLMVSGGETHRCRRPKLKSGKFWFVRFSRSRFVGGSI